MRPRLLLEPEAKADLASAFEIRGKTRRGLVRRFPFGIFYIIEPDLIAVTACMHGRRDPQRWQIRR